MIDLNVRATTVVTHKVAKKMLARKHLSAIINLSSFTSLVPSPMLQVYGATKSYVKHLSRSVAAEYKGSIDVLALAPWYVVCGFFFLPFFSAHALHSVFYSCINCWQCPLLIIDCFIIYLFICLSLSLLLLLVRICIGILLCRFNHYISLQNGFVRFSAPT